MGRGGTSQPRPTRSSGEDEPPAPLSSGPGAGTVHGVRNRLRGQSGQTTVEWLGGIVVVVAIIGVLVAFAPGVGDALTNAVKTVICRVTGGPCGAPAQKAEEPCPRATHQRYADLSVTAFSGTLGGGVNYLREKLSNGHVRITLSGKLDGGLDEILGEKASAGSGDIKVGEGASGEATLTATGEAGLVYEFANDDAANAFSSGLKSRIRDAAIEAAGGPIGGWLYGQSPFSSDWKPPAAGQVYVQGGIKGSLSGDLGGGAATLHGALNGSSALGAKIDRKTGEKTIYLKLAGEGEGELGSLFGSAGVGGKGEGTAQVTVDKNGHPLKLELEGSVEADLSADLVSTLEGKDLSGLAKSLKEIEAKGGASTGKKVVVGATLDLTDPANRAAAEAFLYGANPLTGDPVSAVRAAHDLYQRFDQTGTVTVRRYAVSGDAPLDVSVKAGAPPFETFGGGADYGTEETALDGAWIRRPDGNGFVLDSACSG